jgi:hypothetical protein
MPFTASNDNGRVRKITGNQRPLRGWSSLSSSVRILSTHPGTVFQFRVALDLPNWPWAFEQSQKPLAVDLFPRGLFQEAAPTSFTHR